jgi:hypothetical protein
MPLKASRKPSSRRTKGRKAPTLSALKKRAWKLLSLLIRRSAGPEGSALCYTCGAEHRISELQAGHAIPGRTGVLLLDEEIIRPQCVQCNIWRRGAHHIFATKLIQEHDMQWWELKLLQAHQVKKWTRAELEAKCEEYRVRLAALS